jgi:hypothetical protein
VVKLNFANSLKITVKDLPAFVNLFGIAWFLFVPLAFHFDGTITQMLGLFSVTDPDTAIKYYFMGLYVVSSFVAALVCVANIDLRRRRR